MKKLLTLIFVAAIATLYVMNGKVQGGEHPKAEAPKADVSKEDIILNPGNFFLNTII